ncbi:MAG: hypothetical protein UZ17_ACD001000453 [Acidobacteria bacterium OLB17]|nr:MAG: hypothetical protein UZ17_ACD001000453 [Acidobacteria bacterium OLB17]MCZ2391139.1 hypothetical protein [Acidobacteriota bacterium]
MSRILLILLFVLAGAFAAGAQPRPIVTGPKNVTPAPESFAARYEGGMFGYSEKFDGTLAFDDTNERLTFKTEKGEAFSIPYESLIVVYPQSQSVSTTAGSVISAIPVPGAGLAGFIREKRRYLILQIDDPDANVRAAVNFKLASKELLDSVVAALGAKAKLTQRGDAYFRPRPKQQKGSVPN